MKTATRLLLAIATALIASAALGQSWPARPIRFVATYPPGGGSDIIARTLAPKLSEALGVPVIVENRAGASGNIGTDYVAKSPPDGYTLLLCHTGPLIISPAVYANLPYTSTDFAPVSLVAIAPLLLVTHPSVPGTVGELVKQARAQPGALSFASSGNASTAHLAGEMLKLVAKIDIVHVPYKGVAPALVDLLSGRVAMQFMDVSGVIDHLRAGKVRAVAWASAKRGNAFPDVPTVAESGFPGFDVTPWQGILAPGGTPREIIEKLHAATLKAMAQPEVRKGLDAIYAIPATNTPEEFAAYIRSEQAKWVGLAKAVNLKVE